jgi:hypothetical protein
MESNKVTHPVYKPHKRIVIIVAIVLAMVAVLTTSCMGTLFLAGVFEEDHARTRPIFNPPTETLAPGLTIHTICDVRISLEEEPDWEFVANTTITNNTESSFDIQATAWWAQQGHDRFESVAVDTVLGEDTVYLAFAFLSGDNELSYSRWVDAGKECDVEVIYEVSGG